MRAINDLGASAWSAVVSETARSFASAVRSLEVTPERGSVELSWAAPVHIGHPGFDSYDLRWQTLPGGAWTTVKPSTSATSHTISGLTNFQPFAILLSPLTSTAPGIAEAGRVSLVTMAQGTPPALTGLQVATNTQGQLVPRWDPATQPVPTCAHQNYLSEASQPTGVMRIHQNKRFHSLSGESQAARARLGGRAGVDTVGTWTALPIPRATRQSCRGRPLAGSE